MFPTHKILPRQFMSFYVVYSIIYCHWLGNKNTIYSTYRGNIASILLYSSGKTHFLVYHRQESLTCI